MNLNAPPPSRVQLPSLSLSLSLSLTHTHTHTQRQQKSLSKAWVCRTLRINYEIECVTHIKHTHTPLATPFFPPPTPQKKK